MQVLSKTEIYHAMFVGVALFVGGMATLLLIMRYLSQSPTIVFKNGPLQPQPLKPLLSDIRQELNIEKPIGEFFDMDLAVTDQITELYDEYKHLLPWQSFDLSNNGPNNVYFSVNQWKSPQAALPPGKSINIDFKQRGAIKRVYLKCDSGETANISLYIIK